MAREIKKPAQVREKDLKDQVFEEVKPAEKKSSKVTADAAAEAVAVAAVQAAAAPGVRTISFQTWFQKASGKNSRIKLSYREAIEAHCKAVGLGAQATEEAFDAALKHFGL